MVSKKPRISTIKKLSKNPDIFMKEVASCSDDFRGSCGAIRDLVRYAQTETLNYKPFKHFISISLVDTLKETFTNPPKTYWGGTMKLNADYVALIEECHPYLLSGTKSAVVDLVLDNHDIFYSNIKNRLIRNCCRLIPANDNRSIVLFQRFYRSLDKKTFKDLVNKVPGGIANPNISDIVKKSKFFGYLKYEKDFDLSDLDSRRALVKDLAKSATLCKKLPFSITITKEDLSHLPSVMRFNFLEYLFKHRIHYSKYWTYMGDNALKDRIKLAERDRKVDVEHISLEEIKQILFSLMIHKNEKVNRWIDSYLSYLKIMKLEPEE